MKRIRLLIVAGMIVAIAPFARYTAAAELSASADISADSGNTEQDSTEADSSNENDEEDDGYVSEDEIKYDDLNIPFWLGVGIFVGGGPNILSKPDNPQNIGNNGVAPFGDGGGGLGGGGGAFIETRWLKGHMGLFFGIWNERNRTWTTQDAGGVSGNKFIYYYSMVRLPLLLEGLILIKNHRIKLGLGPEFTVGYTGTKISVESDVLPGLTSNKVITQKDVLGALNIGWGIKFKDWVIGLDLKAAYNFTQPKNYSDRVTELPNGFSVTGSHTVDVRLALSLMWEVGFHSRHH
jgi:hypothetical protein